MMVKEIKLSAMLVPNKARYGMKNIVRALCGFAAALLTAPALAQEPISDSGPYFSFAAGYATNDWRGTDPYTGDLYRFEQDYSLTGTGAFGIALVPEDSPAGFRFEIEGSYRHTEVDEFWDYTAATIWPVDGYLETIGAMANAYVDFNFGQKVLPYLGVGAGGARVSRRDFAVNGVPVTNKFLYTGAFQFMGGAGLKLTPGMIIGAEWRHFELLEFQFENTPLDQKIKYNEFLLTLRLIG